MAHRVSIPRHRVMVGVYLPPIAAAACRRRIPEGTTTGSGRGRIMHMPCVATVAIALVTGVAAAQQVEMVGGLTSILLDAETLAMEAGLKVTEVGPRVIAPGNLGPESVGFVITPPVSGSLPTTFAYEFGNFLDTFSGEINHRGLVTFNEIYQIGNLQIFYDEGFRVADTFGGFGTLFDLEITSLSPQFSTFEATGDLRIAASFAMELIDLGLTSRDLTGLLVGTAYVQAFNVPSAASAGLMMLAGLVGIGHRRRR
jgi:hypothetical protein